jgi:hypothetical protein
MSRRARWLALVAALAGACAGAAALFGPGDPAHAAAHPRCFAAAARDPQHPCRNPALRLTARPSPASAALLPDSPCQPLPAPADRALDACAFGVTTGPRDGTVLLLGDSHARHWRATLDVVARRTGWRGVSMVRPGCPFSVQVPASAGPDAAQCVQRNAGAIAWLAAHPGVDTAFLAAWAEPPWGLQGGMAGYGGGVAQFAAMLDRLPASVRHVRVLRDNPGVRVSTASCVQARLRRHRPLTGACAVPRSLALMPDPQAEAAAARAPRMQVIDLSPFFCGPAACFPVVGGTYVYKDFNHLNPVFAASLGPYVLRALGG